MKCLVLLLVAALLCTCQKRHDEPRPLAVAARPVSSAAPAPAPPPPPPPASSAGAWVESDAYDLKLVSVARCGEGRLGLRLRIRSKTKALFVGPRDAVLGDENQRFEALRGVELEGCKPALPTGHVRRDREVEGYVVFELGREGKEPVLEFSPTRWGGIGTVRVAVND